MTEKSPADIGHGLSRRAFVGGAAVAAGGLILAINMPGPITRQVAHAAGGPGALDAFVSIAADNRITIVFPCSEMGQGSSSGLPMILAEELEADWEQIEVVSAPVADAFKNPRNNAQRTGGSGSIRGWYGALRETGAAAREMLIEAGAGKFGVAADQCRAEGGYVIDTGSGRKLTFGEVAGLAATLPRPARPKLKPVSEFRLIGHAVPRKDIPSKVDGSAQYGSDVTVPGMLYATVAASPVFGGRLVSFDDSAARGVPGFHSVVEVPGGVAVVAAGYWQAKLALDALKLVFDDGPNAGQSSEKISAALRHGANAEGQIIVNQGDARAAMAAADRVIEATYEVPYLAHACMEPMNCTADVRDDGCEVWAPTQNPENTRRITARILGLAVDRVKVNTTYLGGGFGRRGELDFVVQAVTVSQAVGRPVKVMWSREEDIRHDFYRPATSVRFKCGFGGDGQVVAWDARIVAESILAGRSPKVAAGAVDQDAIKNLGRQQPYSFPHIRVEHVRLEHGIPIGFWRSVGHSQNAFMRESFIDEMAHEAGMDPYAFRRRWLAKSSRDLGVLDLAAKKAGWGKPLAAGHFHGIAVAEAYGSFAAQVAEVSIAGGRPRVHRVTAAIDCGVAVNPDSITAQVEGAIVYGLTAAMKGEITIRKGRVEQGNFDDYQMLRIAEMPEVDVHIMASEAPPGGVGEPGTPPIAPAVTNAIFAATGYRVRRLPILKHNLGEA